MGLLGSIHDTRDTDDFSESSSWEDDEWATAETEAEDLVQVTTWRTKNLLLDDLDFAYVYTNFEEAHADAGQAVARAWSGVRLLTETDGSLDGVSKAMS